MLSPNAITASRLILAPLFFLAYFIPVWTGAGAELSAIVLIVLFVLSEGSDLVDGLVARRQGIITELGKVLDPFADVIARLSYFVCMAVTGYLPVWFFAIVIYREFGIVFLRLLLFKDGVALAARLWGKMKSFLYGVCAALGLLAAVLDRLTIATGVGLQHVLHMTTIAMCAFAAILAVASFLDYIRVYLRHRRGEDTGPVA